MKKVLSILFAAVFALAMSSCDKDNSSSASTNNNNNNGNGNEQTTKLTGLKYYYKYTRNGGFDEHTVTFGSGNNVEYKCAWNWPDAEGEEDYASSGDVTLRGPYTYNEQEGNHGWAVLGKLSVKDVEHENLTYSFDYQADASLLKLETPLPDRSGNVNLDRVRE